MGESRGNIVKLSLVDPAKENIVPHRVTRNQSEPRIKALFSAFQSSFDVSGQFRPRDVHCLWLLLLDPLADATRGRFNRSSLLLWIHCNALRTGGCVSKLTRPAPAVMTLTHYLWLIIVLCPKMHLTLYLKLRHVYCCTHSGSTVKNSIGFSVLPLVQNQIPTQTDKFHSLKQAEIVELWKGPEWERQFYHHQPQLPLRYLGWETWILQSSLKKKPVIFIMKVTRVSTGMARKLGPFSMGNSTH